MYFKIIYSYNGEDRFFSYKANHINLINLFLIAIETLTIDLKILRVATDN